MLTHKEKADELIKHFFLPGIYGNGTGPLAVASFAAAAHVKIIIDELKTIEGTAEPIKYWEEVYNILNPFQPTIVNEIAEKMNLPE